MKTYAPYLLAWLTISSASLNAMVWNEAIPEQKFRTVYVELTSDDLYDYHNFDYDIPQKTRSLESIRDWLRRLAERLGLMKPQEPKEYYLSRQDSTYYPACDISYSTECTSEGCPVNDDYESYTPEQQSFTIPLPEDNQQLVIRTNWPHLIIYTLVRSEWGSWLYSDTIRVYNMMTEEYTELSAASLYQFFDQLPTPPANAE
jgi:hypothetical protein